MIKCWKPPWPGSYWKEGHQEQLKLQLKISKEKERDAELQLVSSTQNALFFYCKQTWQLFTWFSICLSFHKMCYTCFKGITICRHLHSFTVTLWAVQQWNSDDMWTAHKLLGWEFGHSWTFHAISHEKAISLCSSLHFYQCNVLSPPDKRKTDKLLKDENIYSKIKFVCIHSDRYEHISSL